MASRKPSVPLTASIYLTTLPHASTLMPGIPTNVATLSVPLLSAITSYAVDRDADTVVETTIDLHRRDLGLGTDGTAHVGCHLLARYRAPPTYPW